MEPKTAICVLCFHYIPSGSLALPACVEKKKGVLRVWNENEKKYYYCIYCFIPYKYGYPDHGG